MKLIFDRFSLFILKIYKKNWATLNEFVYHNQGREIQILSEPIQTFFKEAFIRSIEIPCTTNWKSIIWRKALIFNMIE